jgi:hypothetical protein
MDQLAENTWRLTMLAQETEILEAVKTELTKSAATLSQIGLSWEGPEIEVAEAGEGKHTSELRVWLLRSGKIHDVLEFHIYDNGNLLVSADEAAAWVREQLRML